MGQLFHDLVANWDGILAAVGGLVIACEVLVRALQVFSLSFGKLAALTATTADDTLAAKLSKALSVVSDFLSAAEKTLPRGKLGTK